MTDKAPPFLRALAARIAPGGVTDDPTSQKEARLAFLDTLACILAAKDDPLVARVASALRQLGGSGPAASVVEGLKLSGTTAAFLNGVAAHALDYDDYEMPGSTHPSAVIIPALLAISDLRQVSWPQLLPACLAGYEAIIATARKLGGYQHYLLGWHATATLGPIGGAAACAHLIGLDVERTTAALSIATNRAAGLKLQIGSDTKPTQVGFAAEVGLFAALLAEAGISANPAVVEGPYGFQARYGVEGSTDLTGPPALQRDPLLRKPWPCCAYNHRAIEAALLLAVEPGLALENIAKIRIRIPEPFFRVSRFLDPQTQNEARFSLSFCVASALTDKKITAPTFAIERLQLPSLRALMAKVEIDAYDAGPDLEDMSPAHPDSVTLTFLDGTTRQKTVAEVKGSGARPMSQAAVAEKFLACGGTEEMLHSILHDKGTFRFATFTNGGER